MSDPMDGDFDEVDLSKLTERQQLAYLMRQSEVEARPQAKPTPRSRKPPATPRSKSKEEDGHKRSGSSGKKGNSHWMYDEFANDAAENKEGLWTPKEHEKFVQLIEGRSGQNIQWSTVAEQLGGRTEKQCADYMQRLLDRGIIKGANDSASQHKESEHAGSETQKRPRERNSNSAGSRGGTVLTYKRVCSDQIPPLLPKADPEEIKARSLALLKEIEAREAEYAKAAISSEPPELVKQEDSGQNAPAAMGFSQEEEARLDLDLLSMQQAERAMLTEFHEAEVERLAVWFREGCNRDAFESQVEDFLGPWDSAMEFLRQQLCLDAPTHMPTAQPPKKRLAKLLRQFDQHKTTLVKRQQEVAKSLHLIQSWRIHGCQAPKPNEKAINQVADPGALSVVAHLEEPVMEAKVPTVAAVFPYQVRQK